MIAADDKGWRAETDDPAIACTLEPDAVPARRDAWRRMLDRAESCTTAPDGSVRVVFGTAVELVEIARLVAAEQQCCTFFSFGITVDAHGLVLEARVPAGGADIAAALFTRAE